MTRLKHDNAAFRTHVNGVAEHLWRLWHSLEYYDPNDLYGLKERKPQRPGPGYEDALGLIEALASYLSCVAEDGRFGGGDSGDPTVGGLLNHINSLMSRHSRHEPDTVIVRDGIRAFLGSESAQHNPLTGAHCIAHQWYWEPENYDGDALWCAGGFASADEAFANARSREAR